MNFRGYSITFWCFAFLLCFSFNLSAQVYQGFYDFKYDDNTGKITFIIDKLDQEFLYVSSLSSGVGSNDIGLDRGQLGGEKVVKFTKMGDKILMVQPNYDYRALSDNSMEVRAVEEAFAKSVIHGFKIENTINGKYEVDATSFLMRDAHGLIQTLQQRGQGSYSLDVSRSAVNMKRTKNFPKNTEFDVLLTFKGSPKDYDIRSVTPTASAVTVTQHHSFVELPDDKYVPRKFDPRSGFFNISFYDYAIPIGQDIEQRYIVRHRLEKKNPQAKVSEAVEPIIYYLDPGTPEPVRSALLDGAKWWNQAFEAAGYKDAFQVKMLPEDADPMDVRYNVIQWVHRSTRGWSYGASVVDPRTGEIIKGHVSLGSLRVRQDYLIAQGILSPFEEGKEADPRLLDMALARLRQLSAHEIGHTIGLSHNFAASTNNRASVMDYPHPLILLNKDGSIDFENAYDDKIGDWDKRTVLYGYQDFPEGTNEAEALENILLENTKMGLKYITDSDARPQGGASASAHLWDNGSNPTDELLRILKLRQASIERFGLNSIPEGAPMATLEDVFVPIYLSHRYQTEAVAKIVGGLEYSYAMKGDNQTPMKFIPKEDQTAALDALLNTLDPDQLYIPKRIVDMIPPRPQGYYRGREHFKSKVGVAFDPLAAAESSANHTISMILNPQRAGRLVQQYAMDQSLLSFGDVSIELIQHTWHDPEFDENSSAQEEISKAIQLQVLRQFMTLAVDDNAHNQVQAVSLYMINHIDEIIEEKLKADTPNHLKAHYMLVQFEIEKFWEHPESYKKPSAPSMPDGSPIGCGVAH